jgi:hypothetical protein
VSARHDVGSVYPRRSLKSLDDLVVTARERDDRLPAHLKVEIEDEALRRTLRRSKELAAGESGRAGNNGRQ